MSMVEIQNIADIEKIQFTNVTREGSDPLRITTVMQLEKCSGSALQCLDFTKLSNQNIITVKVRNSELYTDFINEINDVYDVLLLWPDLREMDIISLVVLEAQVTKSLTEEGTHTYELQLVSVKAFDQDQGLVNGVSPILRQKALTLIDRAENMASKPSNFNSLIDLKKIIMEQNNTSVNEENIHTTAHQPYSNPQLSQQQQQQQASPAQNIVVKPEADENPMFIPTDDDESQFPSHDFYQSQSHYQGPTNTYSGSSISPGLGPGPTVDNSFQPNYQYRPQTHQQHPNNPFYSAQQNNLHPQNGTQQQPQQQYNTRPSNTQFGATNSPQVIRPNHQYAAAPPFDGYDSIHQSPPVVQQVLVPSPATVPLSVTLLPLASTIQSPAVVAHQPQPQLQNISQSLPFQQQQRHITASPALTLEQMERARIEKEERAVYIKNSFAKEQNIAEGDGYDVRGYIVASEAPEFVMLGQGINEEYGMTPWGIYFTNIPPMDRLEEFTLIPNVNCLYLRFTEKDEVLRFFGYAENAAEKACNEYGLLQDSLDTLITNDDKQVMASIVRRRVDAPGASYMVWKTTSTAKELISQMMR